MITHTNGPEEDQTPIMTHCTGTRALRTFLWTAFLHLLLSVAERVEDISTSSVLQRHKREWQWNMFIVYEEKPPQFPPEVIGKLKNTNFNESKGRNIEFRLSGEGAGDIFSVNEFGDVLVLKKLDREKISSYKLTAQIFNTQSGRELEEQSEFTIKVQDINDHAPEFSEPYTGAVEERAPAGTVVMTVRATDKDDPSSPNGMVTYTLLNTTNIFSINDRTGEISTRVNTLDRETQSEYKVLVEASDTPGPARGLTASTVVTININDINDNQATFSKRRFHMEVKEDEPVGFKITTLDVQDRDEKQNKKPVFTVQSHEDSFDLEMNDNNDGVLILKKELDYETKVSYTFTVSLRESVVQPPDNTDSWTSAQIHISVRDVDEPPVFSQSEYNFSVHENQKNIIVGSVSAKDTDKTSHRIRYSIKDPSSPVSINSETGQLTLRNALDRELQEEYKFHVTAEEESSINLNSWAMVKIKVLDINDNDPELVGGNEVYICQNDESGAVLGLISAFDRDENPGKFQFTLTKHSTNFSLHDNLNNTASVLLTHGGFSADRSVLNTLEVEITDGGKPSRKKVSLLEMPVCVCGSERRRDFCQAYSSSSVSVSALIAILLCIITILVIVILFVLRKRYEKQTLISLGKPSGEIHEQLVAYDEEGGGEMDTNIYDVSILTSAHSDGRLGVDVPPAMYAMVKKPSACKGDMAAMIQVKKDEADYDRDRIPYDTLHIYGYEGCESLAGSLSSLQSCSSVGSDLDYDFLNDWGPRFRTLAQIYGSGANDSY